MKQKAHIEYFSHPDVPYAMKGSPIAPEKGAPSWWPRALWVFRNKTRTSKNEFKVFIKTLQAEDHERTHLFQVEN